MYQGERVPARLDDRLHEEPWFFDFFQAVRLLEALRDGAQPVGLGGPPSAEVVRFRALPSVNFPPSALYSLSRPSQQRPVSEMVVTFFGLIGPSGVLPRHYTELVMRLQRDARGPERTALRDWLDLFNHRLLSLFYRAWSKYRFWLSYERGEYTRLDPDPFTRALLSLTGLGTTGLRDRLRVSHREEGAGRATERVLHRVDDRAVLFYSGLFAHRPRNAAGLQALIRDYFGTPTRVVQFRGQWLPLGEASRTALGDPSGSNRLGSDMVLGERVFDVTSKFRLCLGPLGFNDFGEFLPDPTPRPEHKRFYTLMHLVRLYVGAEFDIDVQLILRAEEVPECRLPESTEDGPQLGWNAWLTSMSAQHDAADAVFDGQEKTWLS